MKEIVWNKNVKDKCPYCGCEEYYYKQSVFGYATTVCSFTEVDPDNGEMYDYVSFRDPSGAVRCYDCDRILGRFKVVEE